MKRALFSLVLILLVAAQAHAEFPRSAGVMLGSNSWSFDDDYLFDTSGSTVKIFSEMRATGNWYAEFSLIYFGSIKELDGAGKMKGDGFVFAAKRLLMGGDDFSLSGKLGVATITTEYEYSGYGSMPQTESNFMYGIGMQGRISKNLALRAEVERYLLSWDEAEINVTSAALGLVYSFE
jgi:hypothetical protein